MARDQPERHDEEHRRHGEVAQLERGLVLVEVPGEHQRQRELHHLRGLEARDADVQPAPRAVHHVAEERHGNEERKPDEVGGHRKAHHGLRRHLRDEPHRGERHREIRDLTHHARGVLVARGEERREAEYGEHEHQHEQRAVDALGKPQADAPQGQAGEFHQSLSSSSSPVSISGAGWSMPAGTLPSMK